jgi:hypothetical protein
MKKKNEDKRLEEKEKLEAEIARSLAVVKVKETHKQIEDIEKLRKQAAIKSIVERLSLNIETCNQLSINFARLSKDYADVFASRISDDTATRKYLQNIMQTYESIRFDLQKSLDIKPEDFDKLFPKAEMNISTYELVGSTVDCLSKQLADMKAYCTRLL